MPDAACIVSNISSINFVISGVMRSIRAPFWRRTGSPYLRMGRIMRCRGALSHLGPLAHQPGEVLDTRALCGANVIPAAADTTQGAGGIVELQQLAQAEAGIEVISRARGDQRLLDEWAIDERNCPAAGRQREADGMHD